MTQADSVHSTPPTNTSLTRRNMIGAMATVGAAAIATTAPATADVAGPDPIFAAFDAFRRAHALFFAEFVDDIPDEIGDQYNAACRVMQRTRPTTPAGLAVLTTWAREQTDWFCANSSVPDSEDTCALAATIDDATRGMSGLEPRSPLPEIDADLVTMGEQFAKLIDQHETASDLETPLHEEMERGCALLQAKYGSGRIPKGALAELRRAAEAKFPYPTPSVEDLDGLIIPLGEKMNAMKAHTLAGYKAKALLLHFWPAVDLTDNGDEWWPNKVLRDFLCDLIGYDEPMVKPAAATPPAAA